MGACWKGCTDDELMRALLVAAAFGLAAITAAVPVSAEVLAEGPVAGGYYWQKVKQKSGKIVYICRSTSSAKFQKHESCNNAKARKP